MCDPYIAWVFESVQCLQYSEEKRERERGGRKGGWEEREGDGMKEREWKSMSEKEKEKIVRRKVKDCMNVLLYLSVHLTENSSR